MNKIELKANIGDIKRDMAEYYSKLLKESKGNDDKLKKISILMEDMEKFDRNIVL